MVSRLTIATVAALCSTVAYAQQKVNVPGHVVASMSSAVVATPAAAARDGQGMKMTATLTPQKGGTIAGTASVEAGSSAGTTTATVSLTGAKPGSVYPWHVHVGKCGMTPGGKVWGDPSAYKPLTAGSDGTAKATATISMALPTSGDYYVNIHASPSDLGTIVSCGNLGM
jgi:Cu/Zn superoxide dismutase